jgi:hypothetical protein
MAIRKKVLEDGAPLPSIAREYGDVVFPIDDAERKRKDAATLRHAALRLKDVLASTRAVSRSLTGGLTEKLDELLEALETTTKKSAA